ncbi:hypothetical protein C2E23DRAFT_419774 [Lenzites betulinus]|nr:hypothetical protein C2E23DRAFT_419774 [Lenzites betulinus]
MRSRRVLTCDSWRHPLPHVQCQPRVGHRHFHQRRLSSESRPRDLQAIVPQPDSMPHRTYSSAEPCSVVLGPDESPCVQPGYGQDPCLCGTHRTEYISMTEAYKTTSHKGEDLYQRGRECDWKDLALSDLEDVENTLGIAQQCIETTEKEIRERQAHHRRFFFELDDSHEGWITELCRRLREVKDVAAQLRQRKASLVRENQLREEEERLDREQAHRIAQRAAIPLRYQKTTTEDAAPIPRQPVHSACIAYSIKFWRAFKH